MSIFRSTFPPYVIRQLNARQYVLKQGDDSVSRHISLQQYTLAKTPWVKMVSFVNYDSPDGKYSGDQLARKYVLEAGTLLPLSGSDDTSKYSLRSGVGNRHGSYGSDLGNRQLGLRPMPGITSVNIRTMGAYGSLEEATVKFYAWDKKQLDDLEVLFMRIGYPVLLEWGWSQYLDTFVDGEDVNIQPDPSSISQTDDQIKSLLVKKGYVKSFDQPTINPFDPSKTQEKIYDDIKRLKHKFSGNYGGLMGIVKNFTWELMPNGGYECTTVLISIGDVLDSIKMNRAVGTNKTKDDTTGIINNFTDLIDRLITDTDPKIKDESGELTDASLYDTNRFLLSGMETGNTSNSGPHQAGKPGQYTYIQFAVLVHILNTYFNLYDDKQNKLIDIEKPIYNTTNIGNGLCLASEDSVSIDPTVCIIRNTKAEFVTGLKGVGYDLQNNRRGTDSIKQLPDYTNPTTIGQQTAAQIPFTGNVFSNTSPIIKDYLYPGTSLGIIGNIYVNVAFVKDMFERMINDVKDNSSKGGVTLYSFMKNILSSISFALGSINEFDVFVINNKAVIIDKNYVEIPAQSKRNTKYQMNLFGNNSIVRNYKVLSKIFPSQASMIAIAAQNRENITSVQNSTYVFLNKGLTNRLYNSSKEIENATNNNEQQTIEKERIAIANNVLTLHRYFDNFFNKAQPSSVEITNSLNTVLNSILIRVNTDTNYKAIVPISLEVTIDGIAGIFQNQIFTVNPDVLPAEWAGKNLGFIVTGVNHTITPSGWLTILTTQTCLLEQDGLQNKIVLVKQEKQNVLNSLAGIIQNNTDKSTRAALQYNNLLQLIKAYYQNDLIVNMTVQKRQSQVIIPGALGFRDTSAIAVDKEYSVTGIQSDDPGIGYMVSTINMANLTKYFSGNPSFNGVILNNNSNESYLNLQDVSLGNIKKTQGRIRIFNPFILNNSQEDTTGLLKKLVALTEEYQALPTAQQNDINKTIDAIYNMFFTGGIVFNPFTALGLIATLNSSAPPDTIYLSQKMVTTNSFGDIIDFANDPNKTQIIVNRPNKRYP